MNEIFPKFKSVHQQECPLRLLSGSPKKPFKVLPSVSRLTTLLHTMGKDHILQLLLSFCRSCFILSPLEYQKRCLSQGFLLSFLRALVTNNTKFILVLDRRVVLSLFVQTLYVVSNDGVRLMNERNELKLISDR